MEPLVDLTAKETECVVLESLMEMSFATTAIVLVMEDVCGHSIPLITC
ncbi:hypothetical protein [Tenacibaculum amylolyticum]